MSYRSDVSLTMLREDCKRMLARAKRLEDKSPLNFLRRAELAASNDGSIITLYWDSVKWYTNFDDVRFIDEFIHEKDENGKEIPYKMIRIGEVYDDIEVEFTGNEETHRLINWMAYPVSEIMVDGRSLQEEELEWF